jgi:hypothetical protein
MPNVSPILVELVSEESKKSMGLEESISISSNENTLRHLGRRRG